MKEGDCKSQEGSIKILLVEDSKTVSMVLEKLLEIILGKPKIIPVFSGTEAIETIKAHEHLDVLIIDFHLPGSDGVEVMQFALNHLPNQPKIVALSGIIEDFKKAAKSRIKEENWPKRLLFLPKPLDSPEVDELAKFLCDTNPTS